MDIRKYFIFPLLTLLLLSCESKKSKLEQSKNDSINKYLMLVRNDTLSHKERDKWNRKAFSLIDLSKNDTVVRWYLCETSKYFNPTKNTSFYYKASNIHYKKSIEAKDILNIARFYRYRAGHHKICTKRYDSTFYYYLKAEKFYKKANNKEALAHIYFNKGLVQHSLDDYLSAELSMKLALSLIKYKKPTRFNYQILSQLGIIEDNLKNYDEAIKIHKKTLKLAIDLKLSPKHYRYNFISTSLNNIGNLYKEQKKFKKAIYYFEKALNNRKDFKYDPLIFAYLYTNLGYCRMKLNNYSQIPNLFEQAIKIFDSLDVKSECAISHIYLSDYYLRQKDASNSIIHSEKALQLSKESKAPYYYLIALSHAGSVNKNKAPQYIRDYHRINDSLQFEQRKSRSQFYKIQLETDEIASEKEKAVKQKWLFFSAISGLLIIVILLFVVYRQRSRRKELLMRRMQQKTNEEIYQLMLSKHSKVEEARQSEKNRISQELRDGVMHKLTEIRKKLDILSVKNDKKTIFSCLKHINDLHIIENEIRSLSHNLSSENITEQDSL